MTTSSYRQLQQALIEYLSEGDSAANRSDEVCLSSESGEWTRQELIVAVHNDHYQGFS